MRKILMLCFLCSCGAPQSPKNYATIGLYERFSLEYDFVTKHKIQVYCNSAPVTREQIERAAELFIISASEWLMGVDRSTVRAVLHNSAIEWTTSFIFVHDSQSATMAMGAVTDKTVYLTWTGSIAESSLFHEWMHMLIVAATGKHDPDHRHNWWSVLPGLRDQARALGL